MIINTNCRSENGITVGLIDSVISICRVLKNRDLTSQEVSEALKDLQQDEDVSSLTSPKEQQKEEQDNIWLEALDFIEVFADGVCKIDKEGVIGGLKARFNIVPSSQPQDREGLTGEQIEGIVLHALRKVDFPDVKTPIEIAEKIAKTIQLLMPPSQPQDSTSDTGNKVESSPSSVDGEVIEVYVPVSVEENPTDESTYIVKNEHGWMEVMWCEEYGFHEEFTDCSGVTHWLRKITITKPKG